MELDSINTRKDVSEDLSETFGTDVKPAKEADASYGDTVLYVENGDDVEAYVAEGSVQRPDVGSRDDIVQWGTLQESGTVGASGNQYPSDVGDEVSAAYGADVAMQGDEIQGRDETTDVDLESDPRKPGQGFIDRTLEHDQEN